MIESTVSRPAAIGRNPLFGLAALCFVLAGAGVPYMMFGSVRIYVLAYPALMGALAVAFYAISRPAYVGFSMWVWFLSPLVRRLVDYGLGVYTEESLVLSAPYLVGGVGILGLWVVLTEETRGVRQAFVLPLVALAYGIAIGGILNPPAKVIPGALEWGIPITMGALVLADWRQYPRYRDVLLRTVTLGMGVLGVYGLYQFFALPPWDRFWMESSGMINLGRPYPMQIHVWGPMNSPNPYAVAMAVGLIGLLASGARSRFDALMGRLAAVPAGLSLALTQVRTGWGAFAVGLLCVTFLSRNRNRWRVLLFVGLVFAAALPVFLLDPVTSVLSDRAGTITNLSSNRSFNQRVDLYSEAAPAIMRNPIGWGFGSQYSGVDSGLLRVPITLGWGGAALYAIGLALLYLWLWRSRWRWPDHDPFLPVASGVAVATLSVLPLGAALQDVTGVLLWTFLAGAVAGVRYHHAIGDHALYADAPGLPPERLPELISG